MTRKLLFAGFELLVLLGMWDVPVWAQNGGFVYLLNTPIDQPGSILGFSINAKTGALTAVPGSPVQAQFTPAPQLAVAPPAVFFALPSLSPARVMSSLATQLTRAPACLRLFPAYMSQ